MTKNSLNDSGEASSHKEGTYVSTMEFYEFGINKNACRCIDCGKQMWTKPDDMDSSFKEPYWERVNRNQFGALCEDHYSERVGKIIHGEVDS